MGIANAEYAWKWLFLQKVPYITKMFLFSHNEVFLLIHLRNIQNCNGNHLFHIYSSHDVIFTCHMVHHAFKTYQNQPQKWHGTSGHALELNLPKLQRFLTSVAVFLNLSRECDVALHNIRQCKSRNDDLEFYQNFKISL